MLSLHSSVDIPRVSESSTLVVRSPLTICTNQFEPPDTENTYYDLAECMSIVSSGVYNLSRSGVRYAFKKYRGEIVLNGLVNHVELICVSVGAGSIRPFIVRTWELPSMKSAEYLVADAATAIRERMFSDVAIYKRTGPSQFGGNWILGDLVGSLLGYCSIPSDLSVELGLLDTSSLVPNRGPDWYNYNVTQVLKDSYIKDIPDSVYLMNIVSLQFFNGIDVRSLNYFTSFLNGKSRITIKPMTQTNPTTSEGQMSAGVIDDIEEYYAIQRFALIPYDHFEVEYNPISGELIIDSVDCMSGVNTPFGGIVSLRDMVLPCLYELLVQYGHTHPPITSVVVRRTMDEILDVTLVTHDSTYGLTPGAQQIFQYKFDLILLSLISPTMTMML